MKTVTHKFTNGTDGDFEVRIGNVLVIYTKEELDTLINLLTAVKQEIFKS